MQSSGAQAKDAQWLTMLILRLATFNLEHLDYSPQCEEAFAKRRAVLQPLLNKLDFDIVCLQEVNGQKSHKHSPRNLEALDHLLAQTRYKNFFVATSQHPKTNAPADIHNLVILSRWPIEEHQQIYHTLLPQWEWRLSTSNHNKMGSSQPLRTDISPQWAPPSYYKFTSSRTSTRADDYSARVRLQSFMDFRTIYRNNETRGTGVRNKTILRNPF